jgi:hypothetical protein
MPGKFVSQTTGFNFGEATGNLSLQRGRHFSARASDVNGEQKRKAKIACGKNKKVCKVFHFPSAEKNNSYPAVLAPPSMGNFVALAALGGFGGYALYVILDRFCAESGKT